jgi:hypothetical protein
VYDSLDIRVGRITKARAAQAQSVRNALRKQLR